MKDGQRNGNEKARTFGQRLEERNAFVRGMVIGAALAGYGMGTAKAHVAPVMKATGRKLAELAPEALKLAGHAYLSAKDLGYDEEKVRMAERAARRAWAQAKAMMRHAFGA